MAEIADATWVQLMVQEARGEHGSDDRACLNFLLTRWMFGALQPTDRALLPAGSYPEHRVNREETTA